MVWIEWCGDDYDKKIVEQRTVVTQHQKQQLQVEKRDERMKTKGGCGNTLTNKVVCLIQTLTTEFKQVIDAMNEYL